MESNRLGVNPGHQAAEPLTDLLDRCCGSLRRTALKTGRPTLFSMIHLAGELAGLDLLRIFFISTQVCSLMMRGPRE